MAVDTRHPQYNRNIKLWNKIDHVCDGEDVQQYLLDLVVDAKSGSEDAKRNDLYKKRAVFYTVSGQTVSGMLGTVFDKWPTINLDNPALEYIEKNADGSGSSIYQQSQETTEECIRKGRVGLYVTYPPVEGAISKAQENEYYATIRMCTAQQVINWREIDSKSGSQLSLIVIEDIVEEENATDKYTLEEITEVRELFLDQEVGEDGKPYGPMVYRERHWRNEVNSNTPKLDPQSGRVAADGNSGWYLKADFTPRDRNGNTWSEIPFTFIGAQNNQPSIDVPPMKGITDLNVGHYRNSADRERELFFCSIGQPYIDDENVNYDDIKKMTDDGVVWGSDVLHPFKVGVAQAKPDTATRQAMIDKVDEMEGIGARLVQPGSAVKTATQAGGEQRVQHSVLSLIASNVSEAYTQCLQWVAKYMVGDGVEGLEYTLNQDYKHVAFDAQELAQLNLMFDTGKLPVDDYIILMKRFGYFREDKSVEEYRDELSLPMVE